MLLDSSGKGFSQVSFHLSLLPGVIDIQGFLMLLDAPGEDLP
jgi:hypothetical protein